MDGIKEWAVNLTLCFIASSIIVFLRPKGKLEKPMKTLLSLFLLSAIIMPFIKNSSALDDLPKRSEDFGIDYEDNAVDVRDEMNYLLERQGKAAVEIIVKNKLDSLGINYSEIEVITDIAEDGRIIIKDIVIKASLSQSEKATAENEINKLTGIRPSFKE
jgi:hypothetical protein